MTTNSKMTQEDLDLRYTELNFRGRGGFGKVDVYAIKEEYVNTNFRDRVAVKTIKDEDERIAIREIGSLTKLANEPNIVRMLGHTRWPHRIIMECLNTDLRSYAEKQKQFNFTENDLCKLSQDILSCIKPLKKFGIIHRDIKPANLLIDFRGTDGSNVQHITMKLCDLGCSRFINLSKMAIGELRDLTMDLGTNGFMSPEITRLLVCEDNAGIYTVLVDVWGFGATLLWLASKGCKPLNQLFLKKLHTDITSDAMRDTVIQSKIQQCVPENLPNIRNILGEVLKWNFSDRKSIEQCEALVDFIDKHQLPTVPKKNLIPDNIPRATPVLLNNGISLSEKEILKLPLKAGDWSCILNVKDKPLTLQDVKSLANALFKHHKGRIVIKTAPKSEKKLQIPKLLNEVLNEYKDRYRGEATIASFLNALEESGLSAAAHLVLRHKEKTSGICTVSADIENSISVYKAAIRNHESVVVQLRPFSAINDLLPAVQRNKDLNELFITRSYKQVDTHKEMSELGDLYYNNKKSLLAESGDSENNDSDGDELDPNNVPTIDPMFDPLFAPISGKDLQHKQHKKENISDMNMQKDGQFVRSKLIQVPKGNSEVFRDIPDIKGENKKAKGANPLKKIKKKKNDQIVTNIDDLFNHNRRSTLIKGPPGIGKTKLYEYLLLKWAREEALDQFTFVVSFSCRTIKSGIEENINDIFFSFSSIDNISEDDKTINFDFENIKKLAERSKVLVMIDGIDEMDIKFDSSTLKKIRQKIKSAHKDGTIKITAIEAIVGFLTDEMLPGAKILITGRENSINELNQKLFILNLPKYEIQLTNILLKDECETMQLPDDIHPLAKEFEILEFKDNNIREMAHVLVCEKDTKHIAEDASAECVQTYQRILALPAVKRLRRVPYFTRVLIELEYSKLKCGKMSENSAMNISSIMTDLLYGRVKEHCRLDVDMVIGFSSLLDNDSTKQVAVGLKIIAKIAFDSIMTKNIITRGTLVITKGIKVVKVGNEKIPLALLLSIGLLKVSQGQINKVDLIPEHLTVLEYLSALHMSCCLPIEEIGNCLERMSEERRLVVAKFIAGLLGSKLELVKDLLQMMEGGKPNSLDKLQKLYALILNMEEKFVPQSKIKRWEDFYINGKFISTNRSSLIKTLIEEARSPLDNFGIKLTKKVYIQDGLNPHGTARSITLERNTLSKLCLL